MLDPVKPKAPQPETIIELVDHLPVGYVLLAFAVGAIVAVVFVVFVGIGHEAAQDAE